MAQLGFYCSAAGIGVGGLIRFILAWDPFDAGVDDSLGTVYTFTSFYTGVNIAKFKSRAPVRMPNPAPPTLKNVVKLEVKPGGTAFSSVADVTFQLWDGSRPVYSATSGTDVLKVELQGVSLAAVSFQDRVTNVGFRDKIGLDLPFSSVTGEQAYRTLMTPNSPLF